MIDEAEKIAEQAANFAGNPNNPEAWPDPIPIQTELLPVEQFDPDALLPDILREWIVDTADRMPCPQDFVAVAAIVALGSVIGARCVIKPKKFDDWVIVPNLWGAIVGLPSSKKTPAMNAAMKPLDHLIALATEKHQADSEAFNAEELRRDAFMEALKGQLKDAAKREVKQSNGDK